MSNTVSSPAPNHCEIKFKDRRLVPRSLETALRAARPCVRSQHIANWKDFELGLFVDLSTIEWAEITAVVHLLVVIEGALRDGQKVTVALPNKNPRREEGPATIERTLMRIEARRKVLDFLRAIEFEVALACRHLGKLDKQLSVLYGYDSSNLDGREYIYTGPEYTTQQKEFWQQDLKGPLYSSAKERFKHVFPLRWISVDDFESSNKSQDALEPIIRQVIAQERGPISNDDAQALTNILAYELADNVCRHTDANRCLIAVWARRYLHSDEIGDYSQVESTFFEELSNHGSGSINIAIGDSGQGIPATLRTAFDDRGKSMEAIPTTPINRHTTPRTLKVSEETSDSQSTKIFGMRDLTKLMFWSLGRWSTRENPNKKRGTRGLFRIKRLVEGYQGLITLRSNAISIGWNYLCAGEAEPILEDNLACFRGTVIKVRIPEIGADTWSLQPRPIAPRGVEFHHLSLDVTANSNGLWKDGIINCHPKGNYDALCVIISVSSRGMPPEQKKGAIEGFLKDLLGLTLPIAVVAVFPDLFETELRIYAESVSSDVQKERKIDSYTAFFDVKDPILALPANWQPLWIGCSEQELSLLELLRDPDKEIDLNLDFSPNQRRILRQQSNLLKIIRVNDNSKTKERVSLRFNESTILRKLIFDISNDLKSAVEKSIKQTDLIDSNDSFVLTPSLELVPSWIDIATLRKAVGGRTFQHELQIHLLASIYARGGVGYSPASIQTTPSFKRLSKESQNCIKRAGKKSEISEFKTVYSSAEFVAQFSASPLDSPVSNSDRSVLTDIFEEMAGHSGEAPDYVIGDSNSDPKDLDRAKSTLSAVADVIIPKAIYGADMEDLWQTNAGESIVIYCDIILSMNSVLRLLNQAIRGGCLPKAVICLVDGRWDDGDATLDACEAHEIECLGVTIPIIPLIRTKLISNICASDREFDSNSVTSIVDVASNKEESLQSQSDGNSVQRDSQYPISPASFYSWLEELGAVRFSHIARPIGRHFTFYLNSEAVFDSSEPARYIIGAYSREICKWIEAGADAKSEHSSLEENVLVVYPDSGTGAKSHACKIAQMVCERISNEKEIKLNPRPLKRDPIGKSWVFAPIPEAKDKKVVYIDWGAMTGASLLQVFRLTVESGATGVLGTICLSQLSSEEERSLRGIRSFARLSGAPATNENVPVRTVFLTRLGINSYDRAHCPICVQGSRIRDEWYRYPSEELRSHIQVFRSRFKPLSRSDALKYSEQLQRDIYGVNIDGRTVVKMLKNRDMLVSGGLSTWARFSVLRDFVEIREALRNDSTSTKTRTNALIAAVQWIRLLAVEMSWVKRPPLDIRTVRKVLADIASLLIECNDESASQIQIHSIVVLRSTSKKLFLRQFAKLVRILYKKEGSDELINQLLYDAFTYIDQPYHQNASSLYPLWRALENAENYLQQVNYVSAQHANLLSNTTRLKDTCKAYIEYSEVEGLNIIEAWSRLTIFSKDYQVSHWEQKGRSATELDSVIIELAHDRASNLSDRKFWQEIGNYWSDYRKLLSEEFFPLLRVVARILEGRHALSYFTAGEVEKILKIIDKRNHRELYRIDDMINQFMQNPDASYDELTWRNFDRERNWYLSCVLYPTVSQSDGQEKSKLLRFIDECPASLSASLEIALKSTIDGVKFESFVDVRDGDFQSNNSEVFCHQSLLVEIFEELLKNAVKHQPRQFDPRIDRIEIKIDEIDSYHSSVLSIYFSNSVLNASKASNGDYSPESSGQGIRSLSQMLSNYQATISAGRMAQNKEFTVPLSFQKIL